jgi:aminoglycoside phosphotransferase family enzyme
LLIVMEGVLSRASPQLPQLIRELFDSDAYPHLTAHVELIETHISWVFLAGDFAYKIKKPLALGFLDFRELEKRRFYCEEEIRLNQRFAPEIYIGVVKITLQNGRPRVDGQGVAVEYAVRMHRFDQALRLDKQLENGLLSAEDMRELGANIAARHEAADIVPESQRQHVLALTESQMQDNFTALRSRIDDGLLSPLYEWTQQAMQRFRPVIGRRFDNGFFRDCHGDLHLANLLRLPSGITTFDCIEFSADLRYIDVACDIAFLVMDLESKQRSDLSAHFINRYFERTDDYDSMRLFDLYFVYRCLVRAKVDAIRASERDDDVARQEDLGEATRYCRMAARRQRSGSRC